MDYRKIIIVGENNIGRSFMAECILRGILQKRNCQNIEVVSRGLVVLFKDEYDTKLKRIDKEAEQILSDARKKAMQRENEIIADARAEAARIMENAKSEAELEKKRVKDEVKQEIISVAALMSEKIIAASVDEQTQNALFEQTLKEMGDKTWLNE